MGPEVTQEWQEGQRRQLCGQLGTSFLIPEAREKVIVTGHILSGCPSPGLIPPRGLFSGLPGEKALLLSTTALVEPILVGPSVHPATLLALLSTVREDGGGVGGYFG